MAIATIISAAAALGSAVYGAVKSSQQSKKAEKLLKEQQKKNEEWYKIKKSQDYTQRADVQATINKQRELLNEQYNNARASSVVTGGTDESVALQKQAANKSLSDTMSEVAARGAEYKDRAEEQYLNKDAALTDAEIQMHEQRAAEAAQSASQSVNAGINLAGAIESNYGGGANTAAGATDANAAANAGNTGAGIVTNDVERKALSENKK